MDKKQVSGSNEYKKKNPIKKVFIEMIDVSNGLHAIVLGYTLVIVILLLKYVSDNSEALVNNFFSYFETWNSWLIFCLLMAILSISFGKYIMRKKQATLFLEKFLKHSVIKIDLFMVLVTSMTIAVFLIFKLSIYFEWGILLKMFVWLLGKESTLWIVSLIICTYIVFALIEIFETITIVILAFVNKFYDEINSPLDRYTLLIAFIGVIVSLIKK